MHLLNQVIKDDYALYHGDCCEVIKGIPDDSIHYSIFSPPFASLYTYSDSDRDMGNSDDYSQFTTHFRFLIKDLYRCLMPGRLVSVHCMDLPLSKQSNGFIGLRDFRGDIVRAFQSEGFIYHSIVTIWKDPVIAMQRTKAIGLLHKQLVKDSSMSRQGIPDYVVTFRKPGVNPQAIAGALTEFHGENPPQPEGTIRDSINIWQRYASPVWTDINPSDTLQFKSARDNNDEKHTCLAKDSMVLTYHDGYKPIQDICVGKDLVLTHKGRWMPVISKSKTSDCAKTVEIKATGVCDFYVTPNHKFWAKDNRVAKSKFKSKSKFVNPSWIEAEHLKNSYVNQLLAPVDLDCTSDLDERDWWIVGRWLADGHLHKRNDNGRTSIHISCRYEKQENFLEKVGDLAGHIYDPGSCFRIRIKDPNRKLRNVIEKCGIGASNKRIPPEAFRMPINLAKSLLDGYLSGDGHYHQTRDRWSAESTSRQLLLGLQYLILRVYNRTSTLHKGRNPRKKKIQGRLVNCNQTWVLSFQTHGYQFSYTDDYGAWKRVKSVVDSESRETWNIQVLEDASYTAEGCIVKNCPLQTSVIKRCLQLWTNPGDRVLTPFMGIGSEVYVSLEMERKAVGIELKKSYFDCAVNNINNLVKYNQLNIFDAIN